MSDKSKIRHEILRQLIDENRFWSYDVSNESLISDEEIIEKTLVYLDLEQIKQIFKIFSFNKIKRVWIDRLVPQDDYYHTLNRFFAWYYFKSKSPDKYLKSLKTRHLNKILDERTYGKNSKSI